MKKSVLKEFAILLGLIVVVAIAARVMARGETLEEYGKKRAREPEASMVAGSEAASEAVSEGIEEPNMNVDDAEASATSDEPDTESSIAATEESSLVTSAEASEPEAPTISPERVTYMDGFYYEPISNEVFRRISGISYPVDCTVPLDDLRYVVLQYVDFDGNSQSGEMICGKAIAQDVVEIFYELYTNDYRIQSIKLIDEFGGDDTASMEANNTSCFNYRVVDNSTRLSNHAYGLAIDLNPFYNPYVTYPDGNIRISPQGSEPYVDRNSDFPYKIDENDLAYKLFKEHGFKWGGNWNSVKDYQHFEKKG